MPITATPQSPTVHDADFPVRVVSHDSTSELKDWLNENGAFLKNILAAHGAVVFRGFRHVGASGFVDAAKSICPDLYGDYGDLKHEDDEPEVYSSTEYPVEHPIQFHNESACHHQWPLYIFFYCRRKAINGGGSLLVDSRRVLKHLSPTLRHALRNRLVTYQRTYYPHLDIDWKAMFSSSDPRVVENRCRKDGMAYSWLDAETLQTRCTRPVLSEHPVTHDAVLFHQLFLYHRSRLDDETRASLDALYRDRPFPRTVHYDDGIEIPDASIRELYALYEKHGTMIELEEGDFMVLDNMMVAHGRDAFQGPRKIWVAIGRAVDRKPEQHPACIAAAEDHVPDPTVPIRIGTYDDVVTLVRTRAKQRPEAIAIHNTERSYTYLDLCGQAAQIANFLDDTCPPQSVVAVHQARGFSCVASILGIWMSGRVILPIDPGLPAVRKQKMIEKAGAAIVLTEGRDGVFPIPHGFIEDALQHATTYPVQPAYDDAYIFFTSGTTGEPKMVTGTHQGLAHFLHWQRAEFEVNPHDRFAHLTHISFDVVLREMMVPLIAGATLCVPPPDLNIAAPWQWLHDAQITRLHAVPSLARVWLSSRSGAVLPHMRTIFFAGEPLRDRLVRTCRTAAPAADIINLYGPTETTLAKSWYRVPTIPDPGIQPIGHPLPQTQLLLLDADGRHCGFNETGEIHIRTPYRTKQLLPPLGADVPALVQNPYTSDPLDLLYATGDLGRYRADGAIDILGRVDDQIKRFGVRIEPAEITAAVIEHQSVRQAHAGLAGHENTELVLYCAVAVDTVTEATIVDFLKARLPISHLPQRVVLAERLALTPNGKIDRSQLPVPVDAPRAGNPGFTAPAGEIETQLASMWTTLLQAERIGRFDDFFHLGGHSMLAMQLVARVCTEWQIDLSVADLFESSTLAAFAECIKNADPTTESTFDPEVVAARNGFHPLSSSQSRIWFAAQLHGRRSAYHIPGAVTVKGRVDIPRLEAAIRRVVSANEQFRTAFCVVQHDPRQRVIADVPVEIPVTDLTGDNDAEAALQRLAQTENSRPFDLSTPPLARFHIVQTGERRFDLLYVFHHIIADGWSNALFVQQVIDGYENTETHSQHVAYLDYAIWEHKVATSHAERHRAYWQTHLQDAPPLKLPIAETAGDAQVETGSCRRCLSRELRDQLLETCRRYQLTPFMITFACYHLALMRASGQRDVTVGTPVANRRHPRLETVIGCFINTLAIRCHYHDNGTYDAFLRSVKERVLGAFTHQNAPFDYVVRWLRPDRIEGRNPLFQVLFNYLPYESPTGYEPSVRWERCWVTPPESKFDQTMYIRESRDASDIYLVYDATRFSSGMIDDFLTDYLRILTQCSTDMSAPLPSLDSRVHVPDTRKREHGRSIGSAATISTVLSVWQAALGRLDLTEKSHFFAVGGHSLLGAAIVDRLSSHFGKPLPLHCIFECPVVEELAACIDNVENGRRRSIRHGKHTTTSRVQRAIWMRHKAGEDEHYFNVPRAVRVLGILDVDVFESVVEELARRHPMLHTVYREQDGAVRMLALETSKPEFEVVDISDGGQDESYFIDRDARHRFDLTADVLLKVTLLKHSADRYTLIVTTHHIAADCWSMGLPFQALPHPNAPWHHGIFFDDLLAMYNSRLSEAAYADTPEIQYPDIVHWINDQPMEQEQAFWKQALAGAPHAFHLPFDQPRQHRYTLAGRRREFDLPETLYSSIRTFSEDRKTTLFSVLLSAFNLALYSWTGVRDFLIGTPIAARVTPEMNPIIGHISNTLVLRAEIDDSKSMASHISQTTNVVRKAFENQIYPFHRILDDLNVDRNVPYPPLFQVRFVFQQVEQVAAPQSAIRIEPLSFDRQVSKYDLSLVIAEHGGYWRGWSEFNTALFREETIDDFTARYLRVLTVLTQSPAQTVASLQQLAFP